MCLKIDLSTLGLVLILWNLESTKFNAHITINENEYFQQKAISL